MPSLPRDEGSLVAKDKNFPLVCAVTLQAPALLLAMPSVGKLDLSISSALKKRGLVICGWVCGCLV